jgi:UDP-N-acetylmuramate: L-alanyl-gamma-D-glutamyl-meso-diaminopimelate ligase
VAGTHGKTTTSSLLAWILEDAGLNPGFLIGGVPGNFGISARLTDTPFFVIEADEYDTAFCDKRSKFVHYRPRTVVLNNLEYDHADIFPDLAAIETQFHHLVRTVPKTGRIIVNDTEESLKRVIARGCWSEVEWFGGEHHAGKVTWQYEEMDERGDSIAFMLNGKEQAVSRLPLAGAHNRANALAAMAAARHVGVTPIHAAEALERFEGVKRRLEPRGTVRGVTVYDDFAHHPTAIATTVSGLRQRVGERRILAVLEPRSNTMKLGSMKGLLPASLAEADEVFCYAGNLGWDAQEVFAQMGAKAHVIEDMGALVAAIVSEARYGDQILVMSNGGFGGIHDRLLEALARKE